MKTYREWTRMDANASPPLERCLACEAEEGPPPAARSSIKTRWHLVVEPIAIDRCTLLGALASQALIAEAELTPKPGLVDRRGPGAHADLSLSLMRRSAFAIEPFIRRMAFQSINQHPGPRLRATLAATGRGAENAMLRVTNGSNTHKGAIWTLGLLAAAAALNQTRANRFSFDAAAIARTARLVASFEDSYESAPNAKRQTPNAPLSHGQIVATKYGVKGARGEAIDGFPHIVEVGLPVLRARRSAHALEPVARLDALLSIMAHLDDTCLLYRGGWLALQAAQQGAAAVIAAGGAGSSRGWQHLLSLDRRLLGLSVSPGGSADLLAGTLFLDAIERHQTKIASFGIETITDERELIPSLARGGASNYGTIRI
jgi:triphosphoribosyl-dephospho-CoA synthase